MNALTWTLIAMIVLAIAGAVGLIWVRVKNGHGNDSWHSIACLLEGETPVDTLQRNVAELKTLVQDITTRLPPRKDQDGP